MTESRCAQTRIGDDGFTVVEAVAAIMVLAIVFTALAYLSMGTLRASLASRAEQQGIDFATQAIERARESDYEALANVASDLAGDSYVLDCSGTPCVDIGDGTKEPLYLAGAGAANPHVVTIPAEVRNNIDFNVATYVTQPVNSEDKYKRVVVRAFWELGGQPRSRTVATLITAGTRGLPVPLYSFTTDQPNATANYGATASYLLRLTNQGAPDRWDLTSSAGAWAFYASNGDTVFCLELSACPSGATGVDTLLTDSAEDVGTVVNTSRIDPSTSFDIWAVRTVPPATSTPASDGVLVATITASPVSLHSGGTLTTSSDMSIQLRTTVVQATSSASPTNTMTPTSTPTPTTATATPSPSPPTAPISLALTIGDGKLVAGWVAPLSAGTGTLDHYVVEYKANSSATWLSFGIVSGTSATITGLTNGTLYDVRVAAVSLVAGVELRGANSITVQGQPAATSYATPTTCPPTPTPTPAPSVASGFTPRDYVLHNRSGNNLAWPGVGVAPPASTLLQGVPLLMAIDNPQFAVGTTLPIYSSNILATEAGRVIMPGGSYLSNDTTKVVDWRATTTGKSYSGLAIAYFWIASVTGDPTTSSFSLTAQVYAKTLTGGAPAATDAENLNWAPPAKDSAPVTITGSFCGTGWQKVAIGLPVVTKKALGSTESLGVRLWNSGAVRVRVAYDVAGDFPAYLRLPES